MLIKHGLLALLVAVPLSTGCAVIMGTSATATANAPTPNFFPGGTTQSTYAIKAIEATDEEVCSSLAGSVDMCVTGFKTALNGGVDSVLTRYMQKGDAQAAYQAVFRMLKFSHTTAAVDTSGRTHGAWLVLDWQFEMYGPDGNPVVQIASSTRSPTAVTQKSELPRHVEDLLGVVLVQIADGLNQSKFWAAAAPADPPSAADAPTA